MVGGPGALFEWAASGRPITGETVSGDLTVVAAFDGGVVLGVIDGLGHGREAEAAAKTAAAIIAAAPEQPVQSLVEACHRGLKGTRGVVLSLASIQENQAAMTWIGVGNVEAALFAGTRRVERIVPRAGVVGYRLPPLRAQTLPVAPGDILVFASDGISQRFAEVAPTGSPAEHAARLLDSFGKTTDDALVLVARYLGGAQ